MSNFNQWFVIDNESMDFEFSKIHNSIGEKYFVTVRKQEKVVVCFEMKNKGWDRWEIVQPAPQWITNLLTELEATVNSLEMKN